MISLNTSGIRISEIAKVLSKYPNIKFRISDKQLHLSGKIPPECIRELVTLFSDFGVNLFGISTKSTGNPNPGITNICVKNKHLSNIPSQSCVKRNAVKYPTPAYGEIYWVDFGEPFGFEEAFIRPAIVVKSCGVFKSITTVIPLSSKVERYSDGAFTPIFTLTPEDMSDIVVSSPFFGKASALLVEQLRAVDKSRLCDYIGRINVEFMRTIMKNVRYMFDDEDALSEDNAISSFSA